MHWQPIDTAPRDGSTVLLFESYETEPFIGRWLEFRSRWVASTTHYDTDGDACVIDRVYSEDVTHWMPLPPPPRDGEQCRACNGSGWVVRDPDIGTDQECFVCGGSGALPAGGG